MSQTYPLVVFSLDEQRYALPLAAVERVVRAAELAPLPKAPEIVLGVINLQGRIIPVVNLRGRFRLPSRGLRVSDQCLIAHTARRMVALVIDEAQGVWEPPRQAVMDAERVLPNLTYVSGIVRLEDGLILIHDLDQLLSLDEEVAIDQALSVQS